MKNILLKKNKLISLLLTIVLICSFFTACSSSRTVYDETKTQLFISNYGGGYGTKWLEDIAHDFEIMNADFKNGDKVGVEVIIDTNEMRGESLVQNAKGSIQDIFFTEGINYSSLVSSGVALDISDALKKTNTDGKTVWSKLTEQQQEYYEVEGKVYSVPHYFSTYGMTYNVDVFEDYNLYFIKGGCPSEYCEFTQANNSSPASGTFTKYKYTNNKGSNKGNLSAGRDGVYGTYDDGLPATMQELFVLWDRMLDVGVTPTIYTGQYNASYVNPVAEAIICAIDSPETIKAFLDNKGTISDYVVGYANGRVTSDSDMEITVENAYEKYKTKGRFYAFEFMEKLFSNVSYCATNRPGGSALSHTGAQLEYLSSNQGFYKNGNPIAMLMEGDYWENEARDYGSFKKIANYGGQEYSEMRNAFFPLPFADESQIGKGYAVVDLFNASGFINSAIPNVKKDLAKSFLMFCNTDENLQRFQVTTNTFKALNYTLSSDNVDELSYFGRSLYNYVNTAEVKIYQISKSEVFQSQAMPIRNSFLTKKYTDYTGCMHFKNEKTLTGESFFIESYNYFKDNWSKIKGSAKS